MSQSLFEKYGGFATVSRIVSAFYDQVLESERLSPYFAGLDMRRLVDHQTKFISALMGGPASFSNEALQRAHSRLSIDNAAFDEAVDLLKMTFEDFDMEEGDIGILMGEVMSRRSYIVTRKG
ncbi:group I truncated hemoglobin [Aestuariirhabdus litorea]|uniref:Group 1 truncated hemoglobin n=1 Tax=Aestuariirhabdus litorea TaxID=2528527 RepID=A0A3P3VJY0_9GAMM|nr:group 1 truncated hemoglobin [Aestuariirhabdus litorea]RRJ83020.1 group 1 truncated hemoglobin [Aestuariirhabdus litorea]RWW93178.1 group 1 truncated hemoglobin [Endozoicomonadaceae bacterium GTF-13]